MLVYKFYSEGTSLLTGGGGEATRQFLVCIEIGPFVLVGNMWNRLELHIVPIDIPNILVTPSPQNNVYIYNLHKQALNVLFFGLNTFSSWNSFGFLKKEFSSPFHQTLLTFHFFFGVPLRYMLTMYFFAIGDCSSTFFLEPRHTIYRTFHHPGDRITFWTSHSLAFWLPKPSTSNAQTNSIEAFDNADFKCPKRIQDHLSTIGVVYQFFSTKFAVCFREGNAL